ncbi:MAG: MmcQ/YjbR family DNA-binding protein [Polyangiaceae bacterium]
MASKKHAASPTARMEAALRAIALAYPEAHEDFPWGERVIKVRGKIFVFMGLTEDGALSLTTKLPHSRDIVLTLPFAKPTAYGLGKSGWVSARLAPRDLPPTELLAEWIDESYRAVAPVTLVRRLGGAAATGDASPKTPKKRAIQKRARIKTAAKKPARASRRRA